MCGIAGVIGSDPSVAGPRVRQALCRLAHRGPDGEGWHTSDAAVIGMRRLAIIDLAGGDQPIYNEDRSIAVVCNGELYEYPEKFRELTARGHRLQSHSDVNLIPHFYEESGRDAFRHIRGMFAAAIWDTRRRTLILARDRVGKKPLYYARTNGSLAFASEIPALLELLPERPPLNRAAIADYLRLGFVPHPETIYEGVCALPPGTTLRYEPGDEPEIQPYWSPPPATPDTPSRFTGTRADALAQLDAHLRDAVALRLRSDVPVGLFLSGGVDSGLVAAHAAAAGARDLLCFVVAVNDERLNEAAAARQTAERFGLPIEIIPLDIAPQDAIARLPAMYGQPFADPSAIPSYFVAQAAKRHRKVVLNGDGGDEVFAGYRRYWAGYLSEQLRIVPLPEAARTALATLGRRLGRGRIRRTPLGFAARTLRGLALPDSARYLAWTTDLFSDDDLVRYFPDLPRRQVPSHEAATTRGARAYMRSDYRLVLPDDLLVKMDIATMASSVEARSPLLDVPLAEFAWSLPERWLFSPRETKPLLRALAARVLPRAVARAPKRGFEVPVARWLAEDLREMVDDLLLAPDARIVHVAGGSAAVLAALVRGRDDFQGNRPQTLWALLMLEIFLRDGC